MRIKITETEIEATSEDLRQSNTLSESFSQLLRRSFTPSNYVSDEDDDEEEGE